jgi:hypothetical protein
MSDKEPKPAREKGILRWLGLGGGAQEEVAGTVDETPTEPESEAVPDMRERRRRQLLDDIGSFLMTHRLDHLFGGSPTSSPMARRARR